MQMGCHVIATNVAGAAGIAVAVAVQRGRLRCNVLLGNVLLSSGLLSSVFRPEGMRRA